MLPALLLLLLASLPLAAQSIQSDKCAVTGHVTNSLTGEPIKKAAVHLRPTNVKPGAGTVQGYVSTSEADGRFEFEAIPAGDYLLMGDRSGYQFRSGTKVTLRPGQQVTDLTVKLTPQAVISGKVVDEDGDPVGNGNVQVLRQTWQHGRLTYTMAGGGGVNDLGEFRVSRLAAGKYYVFAQIFANRGGPNEQPGIPGKPDIRPVRTFYPDAISIDAAALVQVAPGQDATGIDIRLRSMQTYHVRGHVAGVVSKGQAQRIMLNLLPRGMGTMMPGAFTNVGTDLSFDLGGVAPGSYWLNAISPGRGSFRGSARQAIDVGAADLSDVVVNIVPPGSVHGTVRLEGTPLAGGTAPSLSGIRVWMMTDEQGPMGSGQAMTGEDGTFDIENLAPGRYYPQIAGHIQGAYLKAVRLGQQDVLGQELDFSQGVSGELEIVFRYGAAEVDGTVQLPQNQNADMELARIVLIPDTLNADGSGMESSSLDQNGQFSVKQLRPGHYRAYAFEKIDGNALENPDVIKLLSSSGTDVDLNENDRKQIQLPLTSADDTKQLLARAGVETQ